MTATKPKHRSGNPAKAAPPRYRPEIWHRHHRFALFGIVGYLFLRAGITPIPMVIALLLVGTLETSLYTTLQLGEGSPELLFTRPISVVLLGMSALALASPLITVALRRLRGRPATP